MLLNNKIITGISFILIGGLIYLSKSVGFVLSAEEVIGIALIFYGVTTVYLSLNKGNRSRLFIATVLFFIGIILIVKSHFELGNERGLVFTSILFIGGAAFLILFIENIKEKIFLYVAIFLMLLGYASTNIFKQLGILQAANKIANAVDNFWPVILIIFGLSVFLTRKK